MELHSTRNTSFLTPTTADYDGDEDICTFKKWAEQPNQPGFFRIFTIISVLTILVVLVVLGNALVIAAVVLRRRLRSATGLLILSLAVADLMVGLVVLPFSIANEVLHSYWIFGDTWCTMWLTMDIWMCTASIYNLVAISIDRYIAIIKPLNYPMLITKFRARCIVAIVWISSFVICSPSFLLASSEKKAAGKDSCRCTPANSGMAYIVFSASSSFYIPMIVVIFVYVRIYIAACAATKSVYSGMMQVTATANKNPKNLLMQNPSALSRSENAPILRIHRGSTIKTPKTYSEMRYSTSTQKPLLCSTPPCGQISPGYNNTLNGSTPSLQLSKNSPLPKRASTEEIGSEKCPSACSTPITRNKGLGNAKSVVNLAFDNSQKKKEVMIERDAHSMPVEGCEDPGIVINGVNKSKSTKDAKPKKRTNYGVNMLSKIMRRGPRKRAGCAYEKRLSLEIKAAKTVAIVTGCFIFCWLGFSILYGFSIQTNEVVWSILFWLGYLNSALNPVIYTVFNREFRTCFKRLLTCNNMLFGSRSQTQNAYNSYNSTLRPGKPHGYSSVVSAPPYLLPNRSSPPNANEDTR
ncbi:unnamed protein product [Bursaphelenchus okinawaensis]|uniref:G-protein coupled receptors family 1 profile domain-containing protein n=1 Tax=Bursaphelenchus okinawaensis TaxID=465554 RepID=A0A811JUH9_9BILA|nr:unnamed protein product [Bursaphelenchus okinawaensis]CAG9083144.1 unnamed protein product [Bursaphelenchus okinawaensis]